jgi:hypothetical protein
MKAAVVFTGTGPILVVTTHDSLDHPDLVSRLIAKGIAKFIAHEVPYDEVRRWYGPTLERALSDAAQDDALRIVDVDGRHIFSHLSLRDFGPALLHESSLEATSA